MHKRFNLLMNQIHEDFYNNSKPVHTERWQGWNIQGNPSYRTHELLNYNFKVDCSGYERDLEAYATDIKPNLPWADDHFLERVGGHPINPGVEWANWPGAVAANKHRGSAMGPTLPPQDWAYLAGMIDGEGTIYWRNKERWQGVVRVYQKDRMICDHLCKLFGVGTVRSNNEKTKTNIHGKVVNNHCYYWQVNSQLDTQWLLTEVIPYLVIKKEKAKGALEVIKRTIETGSGYPLKKVWGKDWDAKFNHNYMMRMWPKGENGSPYLGMFGGPYGTLRDVVDLLVKEPLTRQAYLPMFFPEDTGYGDGGRKPCTLGWQFMVRDKKLHIFYPMRSCDFIRHFRDDVYLAIRLGCWIIDECIKQDPETWRDVVIGEYAMHMTSLHIFENDWITLYGKAYGK